MTVRYELNDVNLSFYTTFDQGAVRCGVGDPPEKPQVTLKMKADILDKLFTGRENGPKAAMSGKLSFTGDTIKAMSIPAHSEGSQSPLHRGPSRSRKSGRAFRTLRARGTCTRAIRRLPRPLLRPLPAARSPMRVESSSVIFATRSFVPSRKCTRTDSSLRRAAT